MSNKNIKKLVNSINLPIKISNEESLVQFMEKTIRPAVDNLVEFLLFARQEPFSMSNKFYEEKDIEKQLYKLYKKLRIIPEKVKKYQFKINDKDFTFEKFKDEMKHLALIFTKKIKPRSKEYKIDKPPNVFKSVFFNDFNHGLMRSEIPFLLCSNLFPISVFSCPKLGYSIVGEVYKKIQSFEETQEIRKNEYNNLNKGKIKNEKTGRMEKLDQRILDRLEETIEHLYVNGQKSFKDFPKGFNKSNLDSLIKFFNNNLKQFRIVYKENGKDFTFKKEQDLKDNKIDTGYSIEFINYLYKECQDLWIENELIENIYQDKAGKEKHQCVFNDKVYSNYIRSVFKFVTKKSVNVSKFIDTEKLPSILFGDNYMKYSLEMDDNEFVFKFADPMGDYSARSVPMFNAKLIKNGYLNNLQIIDSDKEKKVYKISYNTAKASKYTDVIETTYTGYIKEPKSRFDTNKKMMYIDLCISEIRSSNDQLNKYNLQDKEKNNVLNQLNQYFNTSFAKGKDGSGKGSLLLDTFNFMGVDLGINPLLALSVYSATKSKKGEDIGGYNVVFNHITDYISKEGLTKDINKIKDLNNLVVAAKTIIGHTKKHLEAIKNKESGKTAYEVDMNSAEKMYGNVIRKYSKFNTVEEYFNYVEDKLQHVNPKQWKLYNFGWFVGAIIADVKKEFSDIRSSYRNAKNKSDYIRNRNFVSSKDIRKIELTKNIISLMNSYTFLGLSDKEKEETIKLKSYWKYLNGIRSFLSKNIASIIVNHAIKNNVNVIFIEDLNMKASIYNTKEENRLQSLWASSQTVKFLEEFAKKHYIVVKKVNPLMTSIIDSETGKLGYRSKTNKSNLFVERDGKILTVNSDVNAARNIAIRGIKRHSNMPIFRTVPVSNNKFVLGFGAGDWQKKGAMMKYLNKELKDINYILFEKNDNKKTLSAKIISEKDYNEFLNQSNKYRKEYEEKESKQRYWNESIIRSGNEFYICKELDEIVKNYEK